VSPVDPPRPRRAAPDRAELEELLRSTSGVVSEIARRTGHSRRQVYRWLSDHGFDPELYRCE
jgi:hypothetical protein